MPTTEQETPFQFVHQTKLTPFEFLLSKSPLGLQFNNFMAGANQGRDSWTDTSVFPVQERLIEGFQASRDAVLLVDVGGGFGHDLQKFHLRFPSAPGRLVLQDLPAVIDQIQDLEDVIERSAHDFLTEQPIKGKPLSLSDLGRILMPRLQGRGHTTCTPFCTIGPMSSVGQFWLNSETP